MTSSTKWMVTVFAVVALFGFGMLLAENVTGEFITNATQPKIDAQQIPPHVFVGTATIDGLAAAEGTVVAAFIDGVVVGSATVGTDGSYLLQIPQGSGTLIFFLIADLLAENMFTWEQGAADLLDLNAITPPVGNNILLNPGGGNVGIGTMNPEQQLHVKGVVLADAHLIPSSRIWKTNINPIEGALSKVQQLQGVSYDWKADGRHDIGLIAEEVAEVIPEVVWGDGRSIDYSRLVAVLIEAVKEQQDEIDQLKSKVSKLESINGEGDGSSFFNVSSLHP